MKKLLIAISLLCITSSNAWGAETDIQLQSNQNQSGQENIIKMGEILIDPNTLEEYAGEGTTPVISKATGTVKKYKPKFTKAGFYLKYRGNPKLCMKVTTDNRGKNKDGSKLYSVGNTSSCSSATTTRWEFGKSKSIVPAIKSDKRCLTSSSGFGGKYSLLALFPCKEKRNIFSNNKKWRLNKKNQIQSVSNPLNCLSIAGRVKKKGKRIKPKRGTRLQVHLCALTDVKWDIARPAPGK